MLRDEQIAFYHRLGYLHVPDVLTSSEVTALQTACELEPQGEVLGVPEFMAIPLHERLLAVVRDLLGKQIVYFGESSARYAIPAVKADRHFHVDARADDLDYRKDYPLLRVAFYLEDYASYSGGLKVRPGSWKQPPLFTLGPKRFVRYLLRTRNVAALTQRRSVNVPTKPGDLAIWNLRTHHAGYGMRLKVWPSHSFWPQIEKRIPRFLMLPEPTTRRVVFITYGAPSEYLEKYFANRLNRDNMQAHWQHSSFATPELAILAKQRGVELWTEGSDGARTEA